MLCMVHLGSCPADERWNTYRISGESFGLRPYYRPAANDIRILSQRSQNEKPESCSNLCGRISGNSREKNPSLWKHRGGFFWHCNRSKHPIPCQKYLSTQIFAEISSICREIVSRFSKNASDFIASWWKSSGNSYEKNPSL